MISIIERPPHELFPWEYAMKHEPPPDPQHCYWMPEELFRDSSLISTELGGMSKTSWA